MTEQQARLEIPSLYRFSPEVRRAGLSLLAAASDGEHSDMASAVDRVLERPDVPAILDFLAHFSFDVVSNGGAAFGAALKLICDEIDVSDFRITMPDHVDPDDAALTFPDIVRPA